MEEKVRFPPVPGSVVVTSDELSRRHSWVGNLGKVQQTDKICEFRWWGEEKTKRKREKKWRRKIHLCSELWWSLLMRATLSLVVEVVNYGLFRWKSSTIEINGRRSLLERKGNANDEKNEEVRVWSATTIGSTWCSIATMAFGGNCWRYFFLHVLVATHVVGIGAVISCSSLSGFGRWIRHKIDG